MPLNVERYPISGPDDPTWHPLRGQDVTASDVGVLYGEHPWKTIYGLCREKRGAPSLIKETPWMERGRDLEPIILEKLTKRFPDWSFRFAKEYIRDPEHYLGATPDVYASDPDANFVCCELKSVSSFQRKRTWLEAPPDFILLQNLVQLYLTDAAYGLIVAFDVDDWSLLEPYRIDRYPEVERDICARAKAFMASVAEGREPEPDFARDGATIAAQFLNAIKGKSIDLRGDNRAPELCREYLSVVAQQKSLGTKRDAVVAELQSKIGDAEFALIDGYSVSFKPIHRRAYEVPATDYRRLRVVSDQDNNEVTE